MKVNFLKTFPLSSLNFGKVFDVRKIENLYCPACGSMMFSHEQSRQFCRDLSQTSGDELIKSIEKYEELNAPDTNLKVFNSKQQEILNRIKTVAKDHQDYDLSDIVSYLAQEISQERFSYSTKEILSKYSIPHYDAKPTLDDEDYADVFFLNCRNKGYSSCEIAKKFIKNKYPTIEHIVPVSDSGINNKSNYLCDCNECNSNRGSTPFLLWVKNIPDFEDNLQIQINQINKALKTSLLDESYSNYPKTLSKTVHDLSDGKINIIV